MIEDEAYDTLDAQAAKGVDLTPLRRKIDADEVGDAALFLLSDLARGVTGENMTPFRVDAPCEYRSGIS